MEEQLIEFVRKNKCLYDKSNPQYKIHVRDKKFDELSRKLNIPARKLKARWRTLRDTFYKKEKSVKSDRVSSNKKSWKWMEQLRFLKNVNYSNSSTPTSHRRVSCRNRRELRFTNVAREDVSRDDFISIGEDSETNNDTTMNGFNLSDERISTISTPERWVKPKIEQTTEESGDEIKLIAPTTTTTLVEANGEEQKANKTNTRSVVQLFFAGLAKQTEDANLSPKRFAKLQLKLLQVFNKEIYNVSL